MILALMAFETKNELLLFVYYCAGLGLSVESKAIVTLHWSAVSKCFCARPVQIQLHRIYFITV